MYSSSFVFSNELFYLIFVVSEFCVKNNPKYPSSVMIFQQNTTHWINVQKVSTVFYDEKSTTKFLAEVVPGKNLFCV